MRVPLEMPCNSVMYKGDSLLARQALSTWTLVAVLLMLRKTHW